MSYNTIADYSVVAGTPNLKFQVELDVPNCVLKPDLGKNQKFTYIIAPKGSGSYENVTAFILGVDENIKANQIKNISVTIDGIGRTVLFNVPGANVILGKSGLEFDFALSYLGTMKVSFELTEAFEIDEIPVSLKGIAGALKSGLKIGGPLGLSEPDPDPDDPECVEGEPCEKTAEKILEVSVPISVKPFAKPHKPEVSCIGNVEIHPGIKPCPNKSDRFDFTVSQKIKVKTPVEFGAETCFDKMCVEEIEE